MPSYRLRTEDQSVGVEGRAEVEDPPVRAEGQADWTRNQQGNNTLYWSWMCTYKMETFGNRTTSKKHIALASEEVGVQHTSWRASPRALCCFGEHGVDIGEDDKHGASSHAAPEGSGHVRLVAAARPCARREHVFHHIYIWSFVCI